MRRLYEFFVYRLFYALLKRVVIGPYVRWRFMIEVAGQENLPKDGTYVLVSNHLNGWDSFLIQASLRDQIAFVAKKELSRNPIARLTMVGARQVFVDRDKAQKGDSRELRKLLAQTKSRLEKEGISVGIFPEGTRSKDGRLHAFHSGAASIAMASRRPIVPVAIGYPIHGMAVIVVGEPIDSSSFGRDKEKLTNEVRKAIAALGEQKLA